MSQPIIWIHGDCLSPAHPAFQKYPEAPALWVWDEKLLLEWRISLKRLLFIYECLLELPVEINRGDVVAEIGKFASARNTTNIVTSNSPSPQFRDICQRLTTEMGLEVEILEVEPFLDRAGYIDLKRFSRYWKVAQQELFP